MLFMTTVRADDRSLSAAHIGWLGLRAGSRLALFCIYRTNRVNSRSDHVVMTAA